ncbi:MAG: heme o synthase [Fimbriimonadaceae bacterium]
MSKVSASPELSTFSKLAWWSLFYNLGVVAWGVYVRATSSGDGCGQNWPLCGGTKPLNGRISTIIEFSHRASTGLTGVLAVVLVVLAVRQFARGSQPRRAAFVSLGLCILEGLIGAVLVKFKLVTNNSSGYRAGVMSFHVVSTMLLMGAIAVAAYTGTGNRRIVLRGQGAVGWMVGLGMFFVAGLAVTGAISALGHTLDPVKDVLKAALQPGSFWMVRLQPYHPYIAIAVGMFLVLVATMVSKLRPSPRVSRAAIWMVAAYLVELAIGLINIKLNAPVWMQMIHLVAADASVVTLVLFGAIAFTSGLDRVEARSLPGAKLSPSTLLRQYIWLTKPRIISLLLFTTLTALLASAGGWPGFWLFASVVVGGYMMAGAANAMNMVVETDLDEAMERTRERPTVTQNIPPTRALGFALVLALSAFAVLAFGANLLTACLAFAGLVFYVSVYTLGLKRRTYHNIVIGGAAGAFPPLVGWAASQNGLAPLAYYLFGIVFLWTPVHFWALAILIKDDYAKAGVPMLPVVKGVRATTVQIIVYTVLTVAITLVPVLARLVGWTYALMAAVLNVYLLVLCVRLFRSPERPQASRLFHYSMLYLALLFTAVAVDRSLPQASPKNTRVESGAVAEAGVSNGGGHRSWDSFDATRTQASVAIQAEPGGY